MANQLLETAPLLKGVTVQSKPLDADHRKLLAETLETVETAQAQIEGLRQKLKVMADSVGRDFAMGIASIEFAAAAVVTSSQVETRRETEQALKRSCKTVIAEAIDRARPALVAFHRARGEALRKEAAAVEKRERGDAERLGQSAEAFQPSEFLRSLQATHAAAIERSRSIESGARVNISELREVIS